MLFSLVIINLMQDELVISLCGEFPKDFVDLDIASDPNFVFENDVNYESVQLFDYDSNSVFVNSFIECAHCVKGGWDFIPTVFNETRNHYYILIFLIVSLSIQFSLKKFFKLSNLND